MKKATRLRQIYNNMKYRCYGPNLDERTARAYRDKGIRVCEEWLGYYGNFESWALSHGYKDGLSIDRIDSNGNYSPENCRWVTTDENRARREPSCEQERTAARGLADVCKRLGPEQLTDSERQDAETMADAILAIPVDKRDRVRDVLFGYRAGLAEGIRIATSPTMLCVQPAT